MTGRREFIGGAVAASACGVLAGEKPVLRVGIVTDTHVKESRASCERVELAYKLFRREGVDMIVNCGDIADKFYPAGYAHYSAIRRETYPDAKTAPREEYVFAYHDIIGFPEDVEKNPLAAFPKVKELLGISHEAYDRFVMGGFTFLVFPQHLDFSRYEAEIASACAANPGKPVFVFDHVPPLGTTQNSNVWGCERRRKILSRFPQVVNICGHAHGSLRHGRNIWQGEFTSVSIGCLATWSEEVVGKRPPPRPNWSCVVMEIYGDRAVFRRFELTDGLEIDPDAPWTVRWPYSPSAAPYAPERRRAEIAPPQFPQGAAISLSCDGEPYSHLRVKFPSAANSDTALKYALNVSVREADGSWRAVAVRETMGEYYLLREKRGATLEDEIPSSYFVAGRTYRFVLKPVDFWGGEGRAIAAEWTAPEAKASRRIWEGVPTPAKEAPDGVVEINGPVMLPFAEEVWKEIPAKAKVRLTIDMRLEQKSLRGVNFLLQSRPDKRRVFGQVCTPPGVTDLRYSVEFSHVKAKGPYDLYVRQGDPAKALFRHIAIDLV